MTVRQLLANTTSEELTEWKLYFQIKAQEAELANSGVGTTNIRTMG